MEQLTVATQHLKPERANIVSDLIAGLTFAVVNVPQAMGHALLATINPVFGIYTLMIAVPVGAIFTSSVFMNVSTTSALSVAAGAGLSGRTAKPTHGSARRPGAPGWRDPAPGGPVPAGVYPALRLECSDDRLPEWRRGPDHPRPVGRPDRLQQPIPQQRRSNAAPAAESNADRGSDHDHRPADAGHHRGAAGDTLATVCLHHRDCCGDRPACDPQHPAAPHGRHCSSQVQTVGDITTIPRSLPRLVLPIRPSSCRCCCLRCHWRSSA